LWISTTVIKFHNNGQLKLCQESVEVELDGLCLTDKGEAVDDG